MWCNLFGLFRSDMRTHESEKKFSMVTKIASLEMWISSSFLCPSLIPVLIRFPRLEAVNKKSGIAEAFIHAGADRGTVGLIVLPDKLVILGRGWEFLESREKIHHFGVDNGAGTVLTFLMFDARLVNS